VDCCIWYNEERPGRVAAPPSPLLVVPNVTAHPSTASVPITVLLYDGPLLCGFNVAIKGLSYLADIGGLELEEIDSSRFKLVLRVLSAHQFQFSSVAFAAEDLDEDVSVSASSALFARLHRYVVRRRCQ